MYLLIHRHTYELLLHISKYINILILHTSTSKYSNIFINTSTYLLINTATYL